MEHRALAVNGIIRESYVEQLGHSVKEKSLSIGVEDVGVRKKHQREGSHSSQKKVIGVRAQEVKG